jgi:hypothetical protein
LPFSCGVFAVVLIWIVWGSLAQPSVSNDESAYLLQARIFASGQLVAPTRPLPEFFQQYHVFVEPVLATKYPPGHSLLLTPGIWLGFPGLVPALLVALTAALLCSLTLRFANATTAVLAVLLATTSDIALRFNPSYFSEVTTAALFLVAWWALLQYWEFGRLRWLMLCATAVGLGAITRPLTMLAFSLPVGLCALAAMRRHRSWRDVAPALAPMIVLLAIFGIFNARVVGDWRKMPHSEYARLYLPSDRMGFGVSPAPPAAQLSADEQAADQTIRRLHSGHVPSRLPTAAAVRAVNIIRGTWPYGGLPGLAVLFAVVVLPIGISRVVIGTLLCVFSAYLAYAQDPTWTLYYLEFEAPLAFLTAVGLHAALRSFSGAVARRLPRGAVRRVHVQRLALAAVVVWLAVPAFARVLSYRRAHAEHRAYRQRFEQAVAALPPMPSVVFVRYASDHDSEERLVDNVPDLSSARTWIVHDRGADNTRLLALAPNRAAYLCRERRRGDQLEFTMERLPDAQP